MNLKINNDKFFGDYFKIGILFAFGIALLLFGLALPVEAADNVTYDDEEENYVQLILYKDSEQYQTDFNYWYAYYTQNRQTGYESTLRDQLKSYMYNTEMSDSERWTAMLIIMGYDFRLENYLNPEKRTIDDLTGAVTYSLGVGNWWANLFGNGTKEDTLPQTIAEGDALHKIYLDNYQAYFDLIVEDDSE